MARLGRMAAAALLLSLARRARGQSLLDQVQGGAASTMQRLRRDGERAAARAREQASGLEKQAEGLGSSISTQVNPALATVRNSTASTIEGLRHGSERAAVKALLWASGKCPELRKLLPTAPEYLRQKLSEAFASSAASPSTSKASCRKAAQAGLESMVDNEMGGESDQEKFAVKISLQELMGKVCTDDLMEALKTMESIRDGHREQYQMAIGDRLLLRVLTQDRLLEGLSEYCGGDGDAAEVSGLFLERPAGGGGSTVPSGLAGLLGAALLAAAVGALATRRCHCSLARLLLGGDRLDEAERGLVVYSE